MDQFEVILRNDAGNRWSLMFSADSFGHAEEQAKDHLRVEGEQNSVDSNQWMIIRIERDYC